MVKKLLMATLKLSANKKERILKSRNRTTFLVRVMTLASILMKVRRQHAKALTPNLQNVRLYTHGGVEDLIRLHNHILRLQCRVLLSVLTG